MRFFLKRFLFRRYTYKLDRSCLNESSVYTFKKLGTRNCVKMSYRQIIKNMFINKIDPRDIIFIAEREERKKIEKSKYSITEERRRGLYKLSNGNNIIELTGKEFIANKQLIDHTTRYDIAIIAYNAGLIKGRKISNLLIKKSPPMTSGRNPLKLIK